MAVSNTMPEQFHRPLISPGFVWKTTAVAGLLALLTVVLNVAGHWYGESIANSGYSADANLTEVIIGTDRLQVPANTIRFANQRHSGKADRLDIFFLWPTRQGYSDQKREVFNDVSEESADLVFATVAENDMKLQMSERLEPVYRQLLDGNFYKTDDGVTGLTFRGDSRYAGEYLFVGDETAGEPFVARCLIPDQLPAKTRLCLRDFRAGNNLSVVYRFSHHMLSRWRQLDGAVSDFINSTLAP
jgi:hypothetical protein